MRLSASVVTLLGLGAVLAACANEPSITRSEVWHEQRGATVVSVSYNGRSTTREAVETLAAGACPVEAPAVTVIDHSSMLSDCPMTKRNRVTFQCVAQ